MIKKSLHTPNKKTKLNAKIKLEVRVEMGKNAKGN